MKSLHLTILGIGLAILVVTVLTLLFIQQPTTKINIESESNSPIDLQNAEVGASIARLVEPKNICFKADNTTFNKFQSFLTAISEADSYAEHDISTNFPSHNNKYDGTGINLTTDQILELLGKYNFNHTRSFLKDDKHGFKFSQDVYDCGFQYNGNYYGLQIQYSKLTGTKTNYGYIPVVVSNKTSDESTRIAFVMFNNTLVFNNTLDNWVTFKITSDSIAQDQYLTIPPHELSLLYLQGNIVKPGDVVYRYQSNELPNLSGSVILKRVPNCIDQETMRSLYIQTGFMVHFPTYVPQGFVPVCNYADLENMVIERFENSTGSAQYQSAENFFHISANHNEGHGIIAIMGTIYYGANATDISYQNYKNDISIAYDDSTFSRYGDGSIMTYVAPGGVSTVVFTTKDQSYTFVGKIPLEDLVKMAKSLS